MEFYIISLIKIALVAFVLLTTAAYLVWIERKVLAHIQLRVGPSRVGPHGLLQPLADLVKLVTKEGVMPGQVNKFFYLLAPFMAVMFALLPIAAIPFGPTVEVFGYKTNLELTNLNIGVLFVLAMTSMGVYGLALAGWASNSKYALMGSLRSSAQMISYELPMAMALVAPLLLLNSVNFRQIAEAQGSSGILGWSIFMMPAPQIFSFFIFLIAAFAETNRIPFDLPEAENELVAGFHTEYSSTGFAAFFTAEYINMVTVSAVATTLFLGGWHSPVPGAGGWILPVLIFLFFAAVLIYNGMFNGVRKWDRYTWPAFGVLFGLIGLVFAVPLLQPILVPIFWFAAKTGAILFLFIWIRGTLPRFRYDQLMGFTWKYLFPAAVVNLLVTALLVAVFG